MAAANNPALQILTRVFALIVLFFPSARLPGEASSPVFSSADLLAIRSDSPAFPRGETSAPMSRYLGFYRFDFPGAEHRWGFVDSGGGRIFIQGFEPAKSAGTLLFIHGYMDHSGCQASFVEDVLSRGWAIYLMDLPGHGLSDGEPCDIEDFEEYGAAAAAFLSAVKPEARNSGHLVAAAHSTGCSAWISALKDGKSPFERTIFGGPLIRSAAWGWSKLGLALGVAFIRDLPRGKHTGPELVPYPFENDPLATRRFPVHWIEALFSWNKGNAAYSDFSGPLTVIQGDRDTVVDRKYNLRYLRERVADIEVMEVKGGTHHVFRYSGALREPLESVLDAYLGKRKTP